MSFVAWTTTFLVLVQSLLAARALDCLQARTAQDVQDAIESKAHSQSRVRLCLEAETDECGPDHLNLLASQQRLVRGRMR
jgi:hypothetical protein